MAEEEHSAVGGGDVLVAVGLGAEKVAEFIVSSTEPQQMRWSKPTLQPFLDVRTAALNDTLEDAFRRRHHGFRPVNDNHGLTAAA